MAMLDPEHFYTRRDEQEWREAERLRKRALLKADQQATSLERKGATPEPPYPIEDEDFHTEEFCDDPSCVCHNDCEINECQVCLEKWIDAGERAMDEARDREMGL